MKHLRMRQLWMAQNGIMSAPKIIPFALEEWVRVGEKRFYLASPNEDIRTVTGRMWLPWHLA